MGITNKDIANLSLYFCIKANIRFSHNVAHLFMKPKIDENILIPG